MLIGATGANAPFLNVIKYYPLVVVPSGNITSGGKFLPALISTTLCLIPSKMASFSD